MNTRVKTEEAEIKKEDLDELKQEEEEVEGMVFQPRDSELETRIRRVRKESTPRTGHRSKRVKSHDKVLPKGLQKGVVGEYRPLSSLSSAIEDTTLG